MQKQRQNAQALHVLVETDMRQQGAIFVYLEPHYSLPTNGVVERLSYSLYFFKLTPEEVARAGNGATMPTRTEDLRISRYWQRNSQAGLPRKLFIDDLDVRFPASAFFGPSGEEDGIEFLMNARIVQCLHSHGDLAVELEHRPDEDTVRVSVHNERCSLTDEFERSSTLFSELYSDPENPLPPRGSDAEVIKLR